MPEKPAFHFAGFENPTTTPVPDVLFDVLAPELTEAELRVLLYVIRRTYGFKKDTDAISLNQLINGITTKDGRQLDRGTGMSRSAVWRGTKGLEEKGILLVEKKATADGDNDINCYSLRFKGDDDDSQDQNPPVPQRAGVVLLENHGSSPKEPGVVLQKNPQQTVRQAYSNIRNGQSPKNKDIPGDQPTQHAPLSTIRGVTTQEENQRAREEPRAATMPLRATTAQPEALGTILARRRGRPSGAEREARQVIQDYIEDFARELGDTASLKSSTTRALHLMTAANVSLSTFIGALHEARSITKERTPQIRAEATTSSGSLRRKTKMGYFFSVLEDVLGLKEVRV